MITALCNIYINSEEKFSIFKETFPLAYPISDNWLIYIRGKYQKEVERFINKRFKVKDNCTFFNNLDNNNWAKSTALMLEKSRYDYIYVFLEDHFLLKSISHFKNVIIDMKNNSIDYFQYSFFNIGFSNTTIEYLCPDKSKYFDSFVLKPDQINQIKRLNRAFYPFALPSVSSISYFSKILEIEKTRLIKVPFILQVLMENIFFFYPRDRHFWFNINRMLRIFGIRFVIYPTTTPFNLEKSLYDCDESLLPYKVGVLNEELFANWDDDNKLSNSSLIKRGLFPLSMVANLTPNVKIENGKEFVLSENSTRIFQYCPDIARISKIPTNQIYVKNGELELISTKERIILKKGDCIWIYANIPHKIKAKKNTEYIQKIEIDETHK